MEHRTRRLQIHLDTGEQHLETVENTTLWEQMGGIGRSFPWMQANCGRITDAFDPANPLTVNVGALTGTRAMTGLRVYFTALSPLKASLNDDPGIAYSAASGDFGSFFRRTGLDDLVILGKAERPSILVLDGDGETVSARLEDGAFLQGMLTNDKIQTLKPLYPDSHFAVIGPAGENLVRYAAIACSTERQLKGSKMMRFAGRAGMGAVMMSKNLLAIVAHGTLKIPATVPNEVMVPFNKEVSRGEGSARYRELGTWPYNIEALTGPGGGLPIRNFSVANDPRARGLYVGKVRETYTVEDQNCTACGIKCWKVLKEETTALAKLDHEPLTLLGPNLDIWDIKQIAHLVELSDEVGVDAISMGVVLGYAMEHGLDGLTWGDAEGAAEAIRKLGRAGASPLLSQGVKRMARATGDPDTAIHSHGMELAAYLGNTDPGAAFALVGNHMTMATFNSAINKLISNLDQWENEIVKFGLLRLAYDMAGLCKFANLPMEHWAPVLKEMNIPCTADEIRDACITIYRMGREIDYRQGFTHDDDVLPGRCFQQIPGQGTAQFMTPEFLEALKPRVYAKLGI
jgi:aldehyde:ferredoxin oxidoreductase